MKNYNYRRLLIAIGGGFSLVEVLVVITMMALLVGLSVPGLGPMMRANEFTGVVQKMALITEQASIQARSQNTYVWIGFAQVPAANGAQATTYIAAVQGKSGQSADLANGNVILIMKPASCQNISFPQTIPAISGLSTTGAVNPFAATGSTSFTLQVAGQSLQFLNLIQCAPGGTVSLPSEAANWIILPLQQTRGDAAGANVAAVQISALNGQVQVFRP